MSYIMDFTNKQRVPLYDTYRSFIDDFTSSKMEGEFYFPVQHLGDSTLHHLGLWDILGPYN